MTDTVPNSYKVTLKTGDHAVFTNNNNFKDYESRLLSGIYGIVSALTNQYMRMTLDSVASIAQVCSHCHADLPKEPGNYFCKSCQNRTWVAALEYSS